MPIKALNPFVPFWYVPTPEKGVENPTRFKIRGLNGTEQGYIQPEIRVDSSFMVTGLSGKGLELALQYGLSDWENFANDAGAVAFSPANFGLIDIGTRIELAFQILGASYIKPGEKKT